MIVNQVRTGTAEPNQMGVLTLVQPFFLKKMRGAQLLFCVRAAVDYESNHLPYGRLSRVVTHRREIVQCEVDHSNSFQIGAFSYLAVISAIE
jgi:hypothetical protein